MEKVYALTKRQTVKMKRRLGFRFDQIPPLTVLTYDSTHRDAPKEWCNFRISDVHMPKTDKRRPSGLPLTSKRSTLSRACLRSAPTETELGRGQLNANTSDPGSAPALSRWNSYTQSAELSPPAGAPPTLQCRWCFKNLLKQKGRDFAKVFDISARHNHIPFPHSTVSTVTDAPAYKIGQRRISVFGRKTRSKRAATIRRAHYWARGRKAGLGGGRIFGVNCMTTQQAVSRPEP